MTNLKKCFYSQFIWSFNAFKYLLRFCFALSVLGSQSQPAGSQSLWEDGQIRGRSARLKVQSTLRVHMPQGTCPREHCHVAVRLTDLWAARSPDSRKGVIYVSSPSPFSFTGLWASEIFPSPHSQSWGPVFPSKGSPSHSTGA